MDATDRLALAAYGEYHRKRARVKNAWLNSLYEGMGGAKGMAGLGADIGLSSVPLVGGVYGGVRGIMDLAHGDWLSGAMRLGGAALNIGSLGTASAGSGALTAAANAGRVARLASRVAPKATGLFTNATSTVGKAVGANAGKALTQFSKPVLGVGTGVMGTNLVRGLSQTGPEAAESAGASIGMDELMNMARSNTMSNPMYAQPGFHQAPNPYGF